MENPKPLMQRIHEWYELAGKLAELRNEEAAIRRALFAEIFPDAQEGTNHFDLGDGYELKGTLPVSRKLDETMLMPMRNHLATMGVSIDPLLRWSCDLNVKEYKALSPEIRAVFDNIVTSSPGLPSLKVETVKDRKEPVVAAPETVETPPVTVELPNPKVKKPRTRKSKND